MTGEPIHPNAQIPPPLSIGSVELETEIRAVPGIPANAFGEPKEGVSLSTALPEQLGLELESERGPVDVLVIDSVEPPTSN